MLLWVALLWRNCIKIILLTSGIATTAELVESNDWLDVEILAEQHSYVVALLSNSKSYLCTGTIINKQTVLSSGHCISYNPAHVLVAAAVYRKNHNNSNTFHISKTRFYMNYRFDMESTDPSLTRMRSNIGIAVVSRPFLNLYVSVARIRGLSYSKLQATELKVVGYGELGDSKAVKLQYQIYKESPCANPKWHKCICGLETNASSTIHEFGNGAPVLHRSEVVGVTAVPCGTGTSSSKYVNIFTILEPYYLSWLEEYRVNDTVMLVEATRSRGASLSYHKQCIFNLWPMVVSVIKIYHF